MNFLDRYTVSYRSLTTAIALFIGVGFNPSHVQAHEEQNHCQAVKKSVLEAGFDDKVTVTCESGKALISSDTYPEKRELL